MSLRVPHALLPHSTPQGASGYSDLDTAYPPTETASRSAHRRALSALSGCRSRAASTFTVADQQQIICAVSEGRGVTPVVGVALINLTTCHASLSQVCDNQSFARTINKIQLNEPSHIAIISTACIPNSMSNLCNIIREEVPKAVLVPLERRFWSETTGLQYIQSLAFAEDVEALKIAVQGSFYAICSFSAAISFIERDLSTRIADHTLRIKYEPVEDTMMIDLFTIVSLELIQNVQNAKSKDCLFGLLNETLTPMGARLLRSSIVQPSTLAEHVLSKRFEAVRELSSQEDMFNGVRKALKDFDDLERLLAKLVVLQIDGSLQETEQAINNILMIKTFIRAVRPLSDALAGAKSAILIATRENCRSEITDPILELIAEIICEDVFYSKKPLDLRNQRMFAVKSGVHGFLDVQRKTFKETTEDLHDCVGRLNTKLNVAGDLKFDNSRGYYLRFQDSDFNRYQLPEELLNVTRKKKWLECQTLEIVKFNERLTSTSTSIIEYSDNIIHELHDAIRTQASGLFKLCESVALIDMLAAFAYLVTVREYVRPAFSKHGRLALDQARHPIMDKRLEKFVPNDYYASEQYHCQIITGCNMSGKSTYLRTIALLQVMAQVGCYVPTRSATFPIIRSLFSRLSVDDSIEGNMSTFSLEMAEMAFILRNINKESLVIVDELGRGTSTRDGLAIAIAIAEALIQSGAQVYFATHFVDLAKVLKDRPCVLSLHLHTQTDITADGVSKMTMLYKVVPGEVKSDQYGIDLARAIGFPRRVIDVAENVSRSLRELAAEKQRSSEARKVIRRRNLVTQLQNALETAYSSSMDNSALRSYLRRLQIDFVRNMEELEPSDGDTQGSETGDMAASLSQLGDQGENKIDGESPAELGGKAGGLLVIEDDGDEDFFDREDESVEG